MKFNTFYRSVSENKIYQYLKDRIYKTPLKKIDIRITRNRLLSSNKLTHREKQLLKNMSVNIHRNDGMYIPYNAEHYFLVGLSAIRCIDNVLEKSNRGDDILSILDFPCGYGRALRLIRQRFPVAKITASEIDPNALNFCEHEFSIKKVLSNSDFSKIALPEKIDLIWCGSLITHLDEKAASDLLGFFYKNLNVGGLCVFTAHGKRTVENMLRKRVDYLLNPNDQERLLAQYHENGYGYADYRDQKGYGISVSSHTRIRNMAKEVGSWEEVYFEENGWDHHQDVYGLGKEIDSKTKPFTTR